MESKLKNIVVTLTFTTLIAGCTSEASQISQNQASISDSDLKADNLPPTLAGTPGATTPKMVKRKSNLEFDITDIPNPYTIAASPWQTQSRNRALKELAGNHSEVLVVPFQSTGYEFDDTTRSILSLSVTEAVKAATSFKVADPILVAEALGLNASTFSTAEIIGLADRVKANIIIIAHIDHNNHDNLKLSLVSYHRHFEQENHEVAFPGFRRGKTTTKNDIPFDYSNLPYYQFLKVRDEMVENILNNRPDFPEYDTTSSKPIILNSSLESFLTTDASSQLQIAKRLQFLAVLHPTKITERYGTWLYERSLVALEHASHEDEEVKFLKAQAYLALNRRIAAIDIIDSMTESVKKSVLMQYASGNVLTSSELEQITDSIDRLTATIRNQRLRSEYDLNPSNAFQENLDLPNLWHGLVNNAYHDGYVWKDTTNYYIKSVLDELKPIPSLSLDSTVTRQSIVSSRSLDSIVEHSILNHLAKITSKRSTNTLAATNVDFLNLLKSQLVENIYDQIYKEAVTRGRAELSVSIAETFEPLLEGQPDYLIIASEAYKRASQLKHLPEKRRKEAQEKSQELRIQGFFRTNSSSPRVIEISSWLGKLYRLPSWRRNQLSGSTRWPRKSTLDYKRCVDNEISRHYCLVNFIMETLSSNPNDTSVLLAEYHNRFKGHKARLEFLHTSYNHLDDKSGLKLVQQELKESKQTNWQLLNRMADTARLESQFNKAADMVLLDPELHNPQEISRLSAESRSFEIGSQIFWAGAHSAAARLYGSTITHGTGSGAEYTASARLATINGDLHSAANYHFVRIRRYSNQYAMRDLIGLVSRLSSGQDALNLASSLSPYMDSPHVWHGAVYAHRANKSSLSEQLEWAKSHLPEEGAVDYNFKYDVSKNISKFLYMSATVDRKIDDSTVNQLRDYYASVNRRYTIHMRRDWNSVSTGEIVDYTRLEPDDDFWDNESQTEKQIIARATIRTAIEALNELYASNYSAAAETLDRDSLCYWKPGEMLWLCAWAAVNTSPEKTSKIVNSINATLEKRKQKLLTNSDSQGTFFDEHISLALIKGFMGETDDAIDLLKLSNADHKYTEDRSWFTRYLILEVARILHSQTGEEAYKSFLLDLARNYTVTDPIAAYNHSFIAMLSNDESERISALAELINMDPHSRAFLAADSNEVDAAKIIAPTLRVDPTVSSNDGI